MRWVWFICWRDDEKQAGATVLVSVHEREVEIERESVCVHRKAAKEYRNGNHGRPTLFLVLSQSTSLFSAILSLSLSVS